MLKFSESQRMLAINGPLLSNSTPMDLLNATADHDRQGHMLSPTLKESSVVKGFGCGNYTILDGVIFFDFCLGLSHVLLSYYAPLTIHLYSIKYTLCSKWCSIWFHLHILALLLVHPSWEWPPLHQTVQKRTLDINHFISMKFGVGCTAKTT